MHSMMKAEVEERLGMPVSDEVWTLLEEDGYVDEYADALGRARKPYATPQDREDEREARKNLLNRARKLSALSSSGRKTGATTGPIRLAPPLDYHACATSALLAHDARSLPEVKRFRKEVLGGRLLTDAEVAPWIEEKRLLELELYLDEQQKRLESFRKDWSAGRTAEMSVPILSCTVPGVPFIISCPVYSSGVLGRLLELSRKLARRYKWRETLATMFILTDEVPSLSGHVGMHDGSLVPSITLEVPLWFREEDVARAYTRARKQMIKHVPKLIGERTAKLAAFVFPRLVENGKPVGGWKALWEEWNNQPGMRAEWKYESWQRLCCDFRRAEKMLLRSIGIE